MSKERQVLEEILNIRNNIELLKNPLYNDAGGSTFWKNIDMKLEEVEIDLKNEIKRYNL